MFRRTALRFILPILLLAAGTPAVAQQFVVDDAAIVDRGACQIEAWIGESSTWLLPACQIVPRAELTLGAGFVPENGGRAWEWVAQAKVSLRELQAHTPGVGIVFGVGVDPIGQIVGSRVSGAYAYVPVSLSPGTDRVILHGNLGWHYDRDDDDHGHEHDHGDTQGHHGLTWGVRSDVVVTPRFTFIAELFGEDTGRPEYQAGIRAVVLPDRLGLDLSWGGHADRDASGAGWTIGFAWTPPAWF